MCGELEGEMNIPDFLTGTMHKVELYSHELKARLNIQPESEKLRPGAIA